MFTTENYVQKTKKKNIDKIDNFLGKVAVSYTEIGKPLTVKERDFLQVNKDRQTQ